MAQQIKKKFIGDDQIDGSKIKLLSGEALKGTNAANELIELIKEVEGKAIVLGQEVGTKAQVDQSLVDAKAYTDAAGLVLDGKIDSEIARANDAESYLDMRITQEVNERMSQYDYLSIFLGDAISMANTERFNADVALDAKITAEELRATAAEAQALADAKVYADGIKSEIMGGIPAAQLDTIKELADALASDESAIGAITSTLSTVQSDLAAEVTRATGVEAGFTVDISNLNGWVSTIEGMLSNEIANRVSEDVVVLDSAKAYTDAEIVSTKAYVDSQDAALSSRLTTVENKAVLTPKEAVFTLGANLTYVDLPELATNAPIHGFVGRLGIFKDEDFSLSVVGGVTRLTFIGSLLSPTGVEKVEAGDVVRFFYSVMA